MTKKFRGLDCTGRRLRKRRIDVDAEIESATHAFLRNDAPIHVHVAHGGGVIKQYKYPAETEAIIVALWLDRDGRVMRWTRAARVPAQCVTQASIIRRLLDEKYVGAFDMRFSRINKQRVLGLLYADFCDSPPTHSHLITNKISPEEFFNNPA